MHIHTYFPYKAIKNKETYQRFKLLIKLLVIHYVNLIKFYSNFVLLFYLFIIYVNYLLKINAPHIFVNLSKTISYILSVQMLGHLTAIGFRTFQYLFISLTNLCYYDNKLTCNSSESFFQFDTLRLSYGISKTKENYLQCIC